MFLADDPCYIEAMDHPLIAKLQALSKLSHHDLAMLARIMDDVRILRRGRDIASEGSRPEHVGFMISGWACRYKTLPDATRQITALLLPGDFCDAHAQLLDRQDQGVAALSHAEVGFVSFELMQQLFDRPAIARALWWASLVDEGILRAWIVSIGRRDARRGIAHLLCELQARLARIGGVAGDRFDCPLSQEDLSDALGLTPVHVNRVLKRLRDDGVVTFRHGTVLLHDLPALQKLAWFDPAYLHFG